MYHFASPLVRGKDRGEVDVTLNSMRFLTLTPAFSLKKRETTELASQINVTQFARRA
jgi:hypothetical protein